MTESLRRILSRRTRGFALTAVLLALVAGLNAQSPRESDTGNFVIGANDRLRIAVWNHADISGEYVVGRDGSFTFPLIGRVNATRLTPEKLESELRRLLMDGFYKDPQVTVAVVENRSKRVFVVGALRLPATYPITGDTSLVEILAKAGSTAPDAADHVLIIRSSNAAGPVLPGQDDAAEVTRVDLRGLGEGAGADVLVHDGDTVFVPRASMMFVYGQVRRPGAYPITGDTTVRQALSLAGGLTEYAAENRLRILRTTNGKEKQIDAHLNDPVHAGDTLVVPERYF
jgi:polysaccharide biosynthesis/export protein